MYRLVIVFVSLKMSTTVTFRSEIAGIVFKNRSRSNENSVFRTLKKGPFSIDEQQQIEQLTLKGYLKFI